MNCRRPLNKFLPFPKLSCIVWIFQHKWNYVPRFAFKIIENKVVPPCQCCLGALEKKKKKIDRVQGYKQCFRARPFWKSQFPHCPQRQTRSFAKKLSRCPLVRRLTVTRPFSLGGVARSDSLLTWKRRRSMGGYGSAAGGGGLRRWRRGQTRVSCSGGLGFKTFSRRERN